MLDSTRKPAARTPADRLPGVAGDEYVDFLTAGTTAVGEYHCSGCGYGVTVRGSLPACPMCAGITWEQAAWSPFKRGAGALQ
jgi:hypothetical protein